MIVGNYFDGDNDIVLQRQQHDCYHEALGIIAYGCLEHYKNAARIVGEYDFDLAEWVGHVSREGFDHRTLQTAHDYIAAYWRWKYYRHDPYLDGMEPVTVKEWLDWLRQEVVIWPKYEPDIVRQVVTILLNQNKEAGYEAEDQLQEELKNYYRGMPEKVAFQSHSAQETIEVKIVNKKDQTHHEKRILSTGKMLNAWHEIREWKRWIFCWPLILLTFLTAVMVILPLSIPLQSVVLSEYIVYFPNIVVILALHGAISLFLPRGKNVLSGIICFIILIGLAYTIGNSGSKDIFLAAINSVFNIVAFWLIYKTSKNGEKGVLIVLGRVVAYSGIALGLLSGLVADTFFFPVALISSLYEGFVNGSWELAILAWGLPIAGLLIFLFGLWIENGSVDVVQDVKS